MTTAQNKSRQPVRTTASKKAGVDGNRTHQTSLRRSTGFEDRGGHQSRIHSRVGSNAFAACHTDPHSIEHSRIRRRSLSSSAGLTVRKSISVQPSCTRENTAGLPNRSCLAT